MSTLWVTVPASALLAAVLAAAPGPLSGAPAPSVAHAAPGALASGERVAGAGGGLGGESSRGRRRAKRPAGGESEGAGQQTAGERPEGAREQPGEGEQPESPSVPGTHAVEGASPPPPVAGRTVTAEVEGIVRVRLPGSGRYVTLAGPATLPVGSLVNAHRGAVTVTSVGAGGRTQTAAFRGGTFEIRQRPAAHPVTDIVLRGGSFASVCRPARAAGARLATVRAAGLDAPVAVAAARRPASRRVVRRLWAGGKGRFRTRGRHGAATVRGTVWLTEDRCDGTLVRVREGVVGVWDRRLGRTVIVRAGGSHLARPRR